MFTRFVGDLIVCVLGCALFMGNVRAAGLIWRVEPKAGETGIRAALAASRKHSGEPRRIILAEGRYYVEKTIVLNEEDNGLTIEGAGEGKTILYGGRHVTGWQKDGGKFWAAAVPEVKEGHGIFARWW